MRKGISTIGVFSMAITFVAAVVLCMQVTQLKQPLPWRLTGLTVWGIEVGFFGLAVLLWRRTTALSGWAVGIVALVVMREAVSAGTAFGLAGLRTGPAYHQAMGMVTDLVPRLAAAIFALMVCYPLRTLLPERLGLARKKASGTQVSVNGMSAAGDAVWVMQGTPNSRAPRKEEEAPAAVVTIATPEQLQGSVEVPLRVLLAQLPADCLSRNAGQYGDSFPVSVPLSLIVPQLKEAQVVLCLDDLRKVLPPSILSKSNPIGLEGEPTLVVLPLEEVVPLLSSGVLELPAPSPPAWAELPDPDSVVFATV